MRAIILAAGRGSRMGSLTTILPKCRTILHGKELLQWQLEALDNKKIKKIGLVRGYLAETFNEKISYFENNRWSESNMVVSLTTANSWLEAHNCLVSYSDIIYSKDVVNKLIEAKGDVVITYDPNWEILWSMRFNNPLDDAETFKLKGDIVVEIGNKANSKKEIEGQFMGLVKFSPNGWKKVSNYIKKFDQKIIDKMDMTTLLQGIINNGIEVRSVAIKDKWYEVDTENDFKIYEKLDKLFNAIV